MPQTRSLHLHRSQIIWLIAIVAVGIIVGILVGPWWGVAAAALLLGISEVFERVRRSRR
jgi:hypothetical protein